MRSRTIVATLVPLVVLMGVGGYAYADAQDVVPGWITTSAAPLAPAPFLTATHVTAGDAPGTPVRPLLDASAPEPDASTLRDLAQALRDDPRTGTSTNVSVIDLITGDVLVDLDAADGQVPASTTKLLTAIAAVSTLGPDATLATVARYDPDRTEVSLVAGGDMLLAADAGTGDGAVGYAGLGDLADQVASALAARGITAVNVSVDTSQFPGPAYPSEWPAYALSSGYAAPVQGLAINVGRKTDDDYAARWPDPAANAADVFAQRLTDRGITATRVGTRDASTGDQVGRVESAPLSAVATYMLHASDNSVAEDLSRVLALATGHQAVPAQATEAVRAALATLGVDTAGLQLYDGAGFSARNRVPPQVLTSAIRAASQAEPTHELLGWLAEAGLTGTLDNRFISTPGAGVVRAKTGSLTGVTALAGVVLTQDGRPLAFAVLADGMAYGQDRPTDAIDSFADALAQCGCGGSPTGTS